MQRNSLLLVTAILLSGCGTTQPEIVYVDVPAVVAGESAPELVVDNTPKPPKPAGAKVYSQPGLPAASSADRTLSRLREARQLIADNRNQSIDALARNLRRVYLAQAEDEISKSKQNLDPSRQTALERAYERIRVVFEKYTAEREPLLLKLNTRARGTDLSLRQVPEETRDNKLLRSRIIEANTWRQQIRAIDAQYDKEADAILAEFQDEIDAEITQLQAAAVKRRLEAQDKARQEAEAHVSRTQAQITVEVSKMTPSSYPATPARQVTVPGGKSLPEAPKVNTTPIFGSLAERTRLVRQEAQIWARTSGYKLAEKPQGARNATEAFIIWRNAHKAGP